MTDDTTPDPSCCLGLSPIECSQVPTRHCDGMTDDPATRAARRIRSEAIYAGAYDSNIAAAIIRSEHAPSQGESADGWLPLAQEIEALRAEIERLTEAAGRYRAALEPFLACVFSDNGELTIDTSKLEPAHWLLLKLAALSPPAREDNTP